MRRTVIIVDDFYADPMSVARFGKGQRYYFPYQSEEDVERRLVRPSWMTSWFNKACECPFKSSRALMRRLEWATGEPIDLQHWTGAFPITSEGKADSSAIQQASTCLWNCCFQVKLANRQELGEGVHNHVTDVWNNVGADGWAGLIYLDPCAPIRGGLKLWRNRNLLRQYDWMTSKEHWELIDDIGHVFNRLVLCRGSLPHSGARGWGDCVRNGRFFQTFFFKTANNDKSPLSLSLRDER